MKVRSSEELVDLLNEQSARRKRELIHISGMIATGRRPLSAHVTRTAVVFAYAHWEGFVKESGRAYVAYVSHNPAPMERLAICFQALACKSALSVAEGTTKSMQAYIEVVSLLTDQVRSVVRLDPLKCVDTESNLTSRVFENICVAIGVDYFGYWSTFAPFMDGLFRARCEIAHGSLVEPPMDYASEVIARALEFIDAFKAAVVNAAVTGSYVRPVPALVIGAES